MNGPAISPADQSALAHSEREERLDAAIALYVEGVQSGRPQDRQDFLVRHPDLTADLLSFFAAEDRLKGLAASVRSQAGNPVDRASLKKRSARQTSRRLVNLHRGDRLAPRGTPG
jgi:hypothetical protein